MIASYGNHCPRDIFTEAVNPFWYADATSFESINERLIREGYAKYWNLGLELENGKAERFEYAQEQAQFDGVGVWN